MSSDEIPDEVYRAVADLAAELGDGARIDIAPDLEDSTCRRWIVTGRHADLELPITQTVEVR